MDTIKNYLDNMFSAFPKTAEISKIKENLFSNMEDKYNELKQSGKSENEAIGIVISEFGNIDELISELGIKSTVETSAFEEPLPLITKEAAENYISAQKTYGNIIGLGVFLCIMAPAFFVLVSFLVNQKNIVKNTDFLTILPLFTCIAVAVAIFIFSGMQLEKYDYLKQPFDLDFGVKDLLLHEKSNYIPTFTLHIIVGVVLCILSPLSVIFADEMDDINLFYETFSIFVLLFLIAIAVFLFIRTGMIFDGYKVLLQEQEFSKVNKRQEKKLEAIASIVWPIIAAIYLLWSFLSGDWGTTWIIWPIAGILYGVFTSIYKLMHSNS